MKIYEIGTGYTPIPAQVAAATESVVEELTKAFISINQPVEILDVSTNNRAKHDLPITEVKIPSFFTKSDVSLGIMHKMKRVVYSIALAFKLKKILKNEKEKVVLHFHNQYNLFFFLKLTSAKIRSKAIVAYTNHNGVWSLPWEEAEAILHRKYFQEIFAIKNADITFVLNKKTGENIREHLNVSGEKIAHINNGVNTDIYRPLSDDEIANIKNGIGLKDKTIVLQVGSVYENKGQARSVEMLAPLLKKDKDLVFAYAGDVVSREYFEKIQNDAKEFGVEEQVIYLGTVSPGQKINEFYNIAHATIFASRYESFGLVCIESLSAGVPVLVCSENMVDFGSGSIVCKPEEFIENAKVIIYDNSDFKINNAARENVIQNYTWKNIAQNHVELINNLMKGV